MNDADHLRNSDAKTEGHADPHVSTLNNCDDDVNIREYNNF